MPVRHARERQRFRPGSCHGGNRVTTVAHRGALLDATCAPCMHVIQHVWLQDAPAGREVPLSEARAEVMTVPDALAAPTAPAVPTTSAAASAAQGGVIEEDLITCSVCLDVMWAAPERDQP